MIKTFPKYFEELLGNQETANQQTLTLELASAILMLEIAIADGYFHDHEKDMMTQLLKSEFDLVDDNMDELIAIAQQELKETISLHEFTRLLTDTLNMEQRVKIVENLWRVAFADNELDKYEEYHIRKISDLLYISHTDYIKAKHIASNEV